MLLLLRASWDFSSRELFLQVCEMHNFDFVIELGDVFCSVIPFEKCNNCFKKKVNIFNNFTKILGGLKETKNESKAVNISNLRKI
jgi:hypothetical protein